MNKDEFDIFKKKFSELCKEFGYSFTVISARSERAIICFRGEDANIIFEEKNEIEQETA